MTITHPSPQLRLLLGTAQWGWTTDRQQAFELLDHWLKAGLREVDAATNYPINKNPEQFRASERLLAEYIQAHGLQNELAVTMKIGSMDNMRTPDINLSPSFLMMMADEYSRLFGGCLSGMMIHWDNREEPGEIALSLEALQNISKRGIKPGLSGIKHPEIYAQLQSQFAMDFDVEIKHNVLASDYTRYLPLVQSGGAHQFLAYGINAGGVKLSGQYREDSTFSVRGGNTNQFAAQLQRIEAALPALNTAFARPPVVTMNHLGLIHAALHPHINGIIVGARTPAQITETVEYLVNIETFDYADVAKMLRGR